MMQSKQDFQAGMIQRLQQMFGVAPLSLIDLLRNNVKQDPAQGIFFAPERADLSYGGLVVLVEQTVQTLNALGFTPASRIAVALPRSIEAAAVIVSVMAGMTVIPISPDSQAADYEAFLPQIHADAVLVEQGATVAVDAAAQRLGLPLIQIKRVLSGPAGTFEIVGAADLPKTEPVFARPEDIAVSLPTSGTTSQSKLVAWTQRELLLNNQINVLAYQDAKGFALNILPFYQNSGLNQILYTVVGKFPFSVTPKTDVDTIYEYLERYQPNALSVAPTILRSLVEEAPQHAQQLERFQLKVIVTSGAGLPDQLLKQAQQVFGAAVMTTYGLTEVTGIALIMRTPDNSDFKPGSVGKPNQVTQLKITDENGVELAPGENGEIVVYSPFMFDGYENNPAANAEAFRDNWFRTGDTGYLDEDGFLYISGRVKEVINRGGSKIMPGDIDEALLRHPGVRDAATFGFPHRALGEDIAVAVVLSDPNLSERDLRLFAIDHLPLNKAPSRFVFVDEIPKTALGKIQRNVLAQRFKAQLER